MNELTTYPWAFWITFAIASAILEMTVGTFSFVFVCVAALITALVASRFDWMIQLGAFSVSLLVSLGLVRPLFLAKIHTGAKIPSRVEILLGKVAQVSQDIDPSIGLGRVEVEGQDWAASSAKFVAAGDSVLIEGFDGIVLIVRKV
jgi:membrane protein implicated in regulation of membrane protease activity